MRVARLLSPCLFLQLALLGCSPAPDSSTATAPQRDAADDVAAELQSLKQQFQEAQQAFRTAYSKATNDEERERLIDELYPDPEEFSQKFQQLADRFPGTPVAAEALLWIVSHASSEQAITQLFRDHLDSPQMATVAFILSFRGPGADAEGRLKTLVESSPHGQVRGAALLALGRLHKSQLETKQFRAQRELLGLPTAEEETVDTMAASEEELRAKINEAFAEVIEKYGDLSDNNDSYREMAERELFELNHLAAGNVAPEIEGEDLQGVPFKLSDYRGKIVFLDFWGHW
jgi:hypothetical protein